MSVQTGKETFPNNVEGFPHCGVRPHRFIINNTVLLQLESPGKSHSEATLHVSSKEKFLFINQVIMNKTECYRS